MPKTPFSLTLWLGSLAVLCGMLFATPSEAAKIDLLLDISYSTPSSTSGGDWQLLAKTDGQGLFSLRVPLTGINSGVTNELPFGRVNGSGTDNAGFSTFTTFSSGQARQIFAGQLVAAAGDQQGLFYGVGTLDNGAPNFPGQPGGTNSIGPSITSLTGLQNAPWGTESLLFSTGATVASGTFAAGATPDFGATLSQYEGSVFTSLGTIVSPGASTLDIDFTTEVRSNLQFGVPTGDYNADGVVDAEDYTVWRDANGTSVTPLSGADGNGDGQVDQADRLVWAGNYGLTLAAALGGPSALGATAIPEPAAAFLALLAALPAATRGRKAVSRGWVRTLEQEKTEQSHGVA